MRVQKKFIALAVIAPKCYQVLADVSDHGFSPSSFDLAFSRFGVMFFADPTASFANLRAAMKPTGRTLFAKSGEFDIRISSSIPAAVIAVPNIA